MRNRSLFVIVIATTGHGLTQQNAHHNLPLARAHVLHGEHPVRLRDLSIRLPLNASASDRSAANALSRCLTARSVDPIPVSESDATDRVIGLHRVGPEGPWLESAEARKMHPSVFQIRIGFTGDQAIEIRSISQAGQRRAVSILCRMVEGYAAEAVLPEAIISE